MAIEPSVRSSRMRNGDLAKWKLKAIALEKERKILKESLLQLEDRFNKLFHASQNMMAITTVADGRFIDLNDACAHMGGFRREELIGKKAADLRLWADPEQRKKVTKRLEAEGRVHNLEVEWLSKSGGKRNVLFSADPIVINGEPCLLSTSLNITEKHKQSEALARSEKKYRILVENLLQGFAIIQYGSIVFCNSALAAITGYSERELLSLASDEIEKLLNVEEHLLKGIRHPDGSDDGQATAPYQYSSCKKDGSKIDMEIFACFIERNGRAAIQCAVMDISEYKRTAEDLQRSLDWQKALFEGSREAIMISDADSKFMDANKATCELTGYSKEELLKMSAWDFNKAIDPEFLKSLCARILSGEDLVGESKLFTKDGRELDAEFSHRLVRISGVPYIHSLIRDITHRKSLELQFQQAQKMEAIGALAGGVAHDFNNLLNVINGYAELALRTIPEDHAVRRDIEEIDKAGQRAASLTSQLLAFSRKQVLQPKILNLNDVLDDINKMLRRIIGEDIDFVIKMRPNLDLIYADPGQIQQIIMNLAVNARDAMPNGGNLAIETDNVDIDDEFVRKCPQAHRGQHVMLSVSDNGVGMDAATQARIFEPFFTTKERDKGTGLGLSMVYGIVKQSSGFVWVNSEVGKGTSIKIYLPRSNAEIAPKIAETTDGKMGGSETILVVEDEPAVRALTCRILKEKQYKVLEARGGVEALGIACEHNGKIDLLLTDVVMPEMSGKELATRLKEIKRDFKVLYVSGYATDVILHHGILPSNVAFLQKPFTIDKLARKVREVIG